MSGKVAGMVWELDIPHGHAWVLMSLADHAHHDGTKVYPGNGLTAWKTGYSVSQVKRIVRDLVREHGLLEPVSKGSGSAPAEYRICIENFDKKKKPEMLGRGRPRTAEKKGGHGEPGLSDPPPVGAPTRARDDGNRPLEPSRRDADASAATPDIEKNTFGFYCHLAGQMGVIVSPEDREQTAKHLKDLKRLESPDQLELNKVVAKMLEARISGYEMSPQKALGKVRGNVVQLRRPGHETNEHGNRVRRRGDGALEEFVVGQGWREA